MEQAGDDGVTFIWKIHNYSYCTKKRDESIVSPAFAVGGRQCKMLLFPNSFSTETYPFKLEMSATTSLTSCFTRATWEVSLLKTSSVFESFSNTRLDNIVRSLYKKFGYLASTNSRSGIICLNNYLDNDTLTVKCRVFEANATLRRQNSCAHTVMNVQRTIYNWKLENLSESSKIAFKLNEESNLFNPLGFTLDASLFKEGSTGAKFEVVIKRSNGTTVLYSTCKMSIVEDGRMLHSKQNEHWFDQLQSEQVWNVSFSPNINLKKDENQERSRFLRLEFATSDGSYNVEKIENGATVNIISLVTKPSEQSQVVPSWSDSMQNFYSEGKLSDATLKTPEKEFPAHKVILCAQSKVFSAYFEHDTKENQTGIVEIEDLNDETVSKMLHFIYTGVFENTDWDITIKLYFAADKYEISSLKEQCSVFLTKNLDVSNVCDCLVLADMHQDPNLKTFAQEFVHQHFSAVMQSEEWKDFMKNYGSLAAETMYLSFSKNF